MANGRKYQNRAPKGYFASLTPEGQVRKVLNDIKNLQGGYDLRNWSGSARMELKASPPIPLQLGTDKVTTVAVPKLAIIIASPAVRQFFEQKPSATTAKFVHPKVHPRAVQTIAKWLEEACNNNYLPWLIMPEDLKEALKLRQTAYTLGMEGYVEHFEDEYLEDVGSRVPSIEEVKIVVEFALEGKDAMSAALARRMAYLRRQHVISDDAEVAYAKLLEDPKYQCLLDVVNNKKARAIVRRGVF